MASTKSIEKLSAQSLPLVSKVNAFVKKHTRFLKAVAQGKESASAPSTYQQYYQRLLQDESFNASKPEAMVLATYCTIFDFVFNEDPFKASTGKHFLMVFVLKAVNALKAKAIQLVQAPFNKLSKTVGRIVKALTKTALNLLFIRMTTLVFIYFDLVKRLSTKWIIALVAVPATLLVAVVSKNPIATAATLVGSSLSVFLTKKIIEKTLSSMKSGKLKVIRKLIVFLSVVFVLISGLSMLVNEKGWKYTVTVEISSDVISKVIENLMKKGA